MGSRNERGKGFSFVVGTPLFFEDLSVHMGNFNY